MLICSAEGPTDNPVSAEPLTAEPATAEPATAEPMIAEPTTAEPTTAEPTTAEPTTECIAGLENHFNSSYSLTVSTLDDSVSLLVRTPRRTHYMPENIFSTPSKPTNISHSTPKEAPCSSNKRSKNDSSILEELLQVCKGILGHVTAIEARQKQL